MSMWLVVLVTFIYAYVSIEQYFKGDLSLAVVYLGYTVANFGLIMVVK
jgi:hypothetical protein